MVATKPKSKHKRPVHRSVTFQYTRKRKLNSGFGAGVQSSFPARQRARKLLLLRKKGARDLSSEPRGRARKLPGEKAAVAAFVTPPPRRGRSRSRSRGRSPARAAIAAGGRSPSPAPVMAPIGELDRQLAEIDGRRAARRVYNVVNDILHGRGSRALTRSVGFLTDKLYMLRRLFGLPFTLRRAP